MANDNEVSFELKVQDLLTNNLQSIVGKGVSSLNLLDVAGSSLSSSLSSALGAIASPAGLAAIAIGTLTAVLAGATAKGMAFTKAMSGVKAILLATKEDGEKLKQTAISLGASTVFTSTQVAEAMQVAAQAGQTTSQIIAEMPGFLNLASSAQIDLASAVEIGLSAMHQFQKPASEMNSIVDQLSYTTVKSATGLQDLAEGLKYIGTASAVMKVPMSETLATLGTFADFGEKGSIGARSFSTSLQRLAAPTKAMREVMKQLNIQFYDSKGQFIGINNSVALLETRMKGFTDKQKGAAISTLFGNEAYSEWMILLTKGSKELKKLTGDIEKSNGTAAEIAKRQKDNLSGDAEKVSGGLESIALKIYDGIEPVLRFFTQLFSSGLDSLLGVWDDFFAPIAEVRDAFGELFTEIGKVFRIFSTANEGIDIFGLSIKALAFSMRIAFVPIRALVGILSWLVSLVRRAIEPFAGLFNTIKQFALKVVDFLSPVGDIIEGIFTLNFEKVKTGGKALTENLKGLLNGTYQPKVKASIEVANSATGTTKQIAPYTAPAVASLTGNGSDIEGNGKGGGKSVVVTINNLINSLNVTGTNLSDIESKIRETVSKTLIDAVRDFETSYQ